MTLNTKLIVFRIIIIIGVCILAAILIMKLCGIEVSDWWFIANSIWLIIFGILAKNLEQAKKENEKFGD